MTMTESRTPVLENQQKKVFRTVKQEEPLIVKRAPHVHAAVTPAARNWVLFIALIPAILASAISFGFSAVILIFNSIAAFVVFELVTEKIFKQKIRIWDGNSVLLGTIMGLLLNQDVPVWMCWLGAFFAAFAKNRFHPSLFGLLILLFLNSVILDHSEIFVSVLPVQIALIGGGIFLAAKRIIRWQNPVAYLSAFVLSAFCFGINPLSFPFAGAALLAGIFAATDSMTTPLTLKGNFVFCALAGILSIVLGTVTGGLEGIVFSILIMNLFVPLIDRYVRIKPYTV